MKLLIISSFSTLLPTCETYPATGGRFVMHVTSIPTERTQLQYRPGLSLGLLQGVARTAVEDERVWFAHCYSAGPHPAIGPTVRFYPPPHRHAHKTGHSARD